MWCVLHLLHARRYLRRAINVMVESTLVVFGKLLLASVLGMLIGTERAVLAKQAAGSRTFALVALGSCLFVVIGLWVNNAYLGYVNFDPLRVAAAIVTGVGFIGAGLIFFRQQSVHGITTAAGLWIAAGLGMAAGFGMYAIAIFSAVLTLLILTGMWYVESRLKERFGLIQENDSQGI